MKTKNKVRSLKIAYILVLLLAAIYNFADMQKGFVEGITGAQSKFRHPLMVILSLFAASIGIAIVTKMYSFINSIQNDSVFSLVNIKRITTIGWFCVLQAMLLYIFYFFEAKANINQISLYDLMVSVNFDFWLLIFGLTMLLVGFVFKKGIELQNEQELTI